MDNPQVFVLILKNIVATFTKLNRENCNECILDMGEYIGKLVAGKDSVLKFE